MQKKTKNITQISLQVGAKEPATLWSKSHCVCVYEHYHALWAIVCTCIHLHILIYTHIFKMLRLNNSNNNVYISYVLRDW